MDETANVLGEDFGRCRDPFASEPPYGADVRYDPDYEALREEVQKASVDWKQVKAGSIEILSSRSKDLTVAGYLTLALFRVDGYGGLGDGLKIVRAFVGEHWEGIFPEGSRPRGRVLALEWLNQSLTPFVESREPRAEEIDLLESLHEDLLGIRKAAADRLDKQAPQLSNLRKAISARISASPVKPSAGSPGEQVAAGQAADSATPTHRGGGLPVDKELEADASAKQVKDRVRPLVAFLRRAEWRSPAPYRILRSLKWDDLDAPPPADAQTGKTKVPQPRNADSLENLLAGGKWAELLEASEGAFQAGGGTFWLDLQLYTVTALRELSPPAGDVAAQVVTSELAALLDRFPKLSELTFADGTPFANDATQQWIAASVQEDDLPLAGVAGSAAAEPVLDRQRIEEARTLLGQNKLTSALDVLQGAVDDAPDPRSRFRARLGVGQVLLKANRHPWARSVLEELRENMHGFKLTEWEPEVAVELLKLLAICYGRMLNKASGEDQSDLQRSLNKVKSELSRLDLRAAAAVDEALSG